MDGVGEQGGLEGGQAHRAAGRQRREQIAVHERLAPPPHRRPVSAIGQRRAWQRTAPRDDAARCPDAHHRRGGRAARAIPLHGEAQGQARRGGDMGAARLPQPHLRGGRRSGGLGGRRTMLLLLLVVIDVDLLIHSIVPN